MKLKTVNIREFIDKGWPSEPFVFKGRTFDIPNTVVSAINAMPDNCVGFGVGVFGGTDMIIAAERAARRKGIRILWRRYGTYDQR